MSYRSKLSHQHQLQTRGEVSYRRKLSQQQHTSPLSVFLKDLLTAQYSMKLREKLRVCMKLVMTLTTWAVSACWVYCMENLMSSEGVTSTRKLTTMATRVAVTLFRATLEGRRRPPCLKSPHDFVPALEATCFPPPPGDLKVTFRI